MLPPVLRQYGGYAVLIQSASAAPALTFAIGCRQQAKWSALSAFDGLRYPDSSTLV
jgi:hypothetical protein